MAEHLHPNGTAALGLQEDGANAAFESRVVNIVLIAVALCILAVAGLYSITVCYNRSRRSKRAHVYESAVTPRDPAEPVAVRAVKRSSSFTKALAFSRKAEAAKDNSRIYYIYSNPLPVGLREEEEEEERRNRELPLAFHEFSRDPRSGATLDPPIFYMQL